MTYNNDKIVDFSFVNFKRKNKIYKKKIYFIFANFMKDNLRNNITNKSQFFIDITYYAIPRNNNNYKFCVIMAFNKANKMT